MRHFVTVGVLVILVFLLTYFGLTAIKLMPIEASAQSIPVDWMWNLDFIVMCFLFALIVVPLIYSLIVFRRRKGDTSDGEHIEGNTKLEITWTVIPLIVVLVFAYLGAYSLGETMVVDPNALEINVTARQWSWQFDYPEGFTSNELHLPVNRQVVLNMTSLDVIHAFWVPEFRIRQDIVPGRITNYRITPILVGNYKVMCSQLCGTSHSYMIAPVIVTSQADYDAWVQSQATAAQAAAAAGGPANGKLLVAKNGCLGCHSADGSKLVGPTWQGLYQSQVKLADGRTVTADQAYLTESIVNPSAKIVNGFPDNVMPKTFGTSLTQSQVNDIVSYIESLK
jgi:cytochrome c oxidase subunit 2